MTINIYLVNQDCLVWDVNDIITIRNKYRLLGSLIGSVENLRNLSTINSVPLLLSPFEVKLGLEKQWFQIIDESLSYPTVTPDQLLEYQEYKSKQNQIQMDKYKEQRLKKEIEFRKLKQQEGEPQPEQEEKQQNKKQKTSDPNKMFINYDINIYSSTKEAIEKEEITKSLWRDKRDEKSVVLGLDQYKFPQNEMDIMKYKIFKDLWSRGYFISGGSKFGGTFLVYKGDPFLFHATFIVVIKGYSQTFQSLDIITTARLAVHVNKTTLLASIDPITNIPNYIAINWKGVT